MKIALLQMRVRVGDRPANRAAVARMVRDLVQGGTPPDVFVLPELWSTGYALDRAGELAAAEDDARFLGELARRCGAAFVGGSVLCAENGRVFNRAQVIGRDGVLRAHYDKIHLFRLMDEDRYLAGGKSPLLFELDGLRCGTEICYDIRFGELSRLLAVHGAEVLFVAAEWPLSRSEHWLTLLRARAVENQMYVAACNCCGPCGGEVFAGHSLVVAPDGRIVCEAGTEEGSLLAEIDRQAVGQARQSIPVFRDRVPEVYTGGALRIVKRC